MNGKLIIITGAAMGLGYATAEEVASKGANLLLVDFNADALKEAKEKLAKKFKNIRVESAIADVSKDEDVKNFVDFAVKIFGKIDGLYNNAGTEGKIAPIIESEVDNIKRVIDINLMGVYFGMKYVLPVMKKQNFGKIVNVASITGIRGVPECVAYVATKHAVAGMTKAAAIEYGANAILTNAIAPGPILTPMVEQVLKNRNPENPEQAEADFANLNPMKRIGRPHEVAKLVSFLLSDDNSYINGQIIAIDGGQTNAF